MTHCGTVVLALLAAALCCAAGRAQTVGHVEASWDFAGGADGWARATAEELHADVRHAGSELRGVVQGMSPHVDSTPFIVPVAARHYVALRMQYRGSAAMARLIARTGGALPHPLASLTLNASATEPHDMLVFDLPLSRTPQYDVWVRPVHPQAGAITQFRLHPGAPHGAGAERRAPTRGDAFAVDWVRILRAPALHGATGCVAGRGDLLFAQPPDLARVGLPSRPDFMRNITQEADGLAHGPTEQDEVGRLQLRAEGGSVSLAYALTYNCRRIGGEVVTIFGQDFGRVLPHVLVGGTPCASLRWVHENTAVACELPAGVGEWVDVTLINGELPELNATLPLLSYAEPVPPVAPPALSNVASHALTAHWVPPSNPYHAAMTTGYLVVATPAVDAGATVQQAFDPLLAGAQAGAQARRRLLQLGGRSQFVQNITTTSITGLLPDTPYVVLVAPLNEEQSWPGLAEGDLYGRRVPATGVLTGAFCAPNASARTLRYDFEFPRFSANVTLHHGPTDGRNSTDQLGVAGGEGHYGLVLLGSAHVQGCNTSHACCDLLTPAGSLAPDQPLSHDGAALDNSAACALVCGSAAELGVAWGEEWAEEAAPAAASAGAASAFDHGADLHELGRSHALQLLNGRGVTPRSVLAGNGARVAAAGPHLFNGTHTCGAALRLTASRARQTGAAWYPRAQDVREGFVTEFEFRVSNPSFHCRHMQDVYTHCRSRGGDGFAFVVQGSAPDVMGQQAEGLGYAGLDNALAVEFDTWSNAELDDPYENHIAVLTGGWRHPIQAHHTEALAASVGVPDLTDGVHRVRIEYVPPSPTLTLHDELFAMDATPHTSFFFENAAFPAGGQPDWGAGVGVLRIFMDDMLQPVLATPLTLHHTLRLPQGRAWVGLTAATGEDVWQVHDILSWHFASTRAPDWTEGSPPPIVNGVGAFHCHPGDQQCVHW